MGCKRPNFFTDTFKSNVLANKAFTWMIAGVTERWKIPIGYDLTTGSFNPTAVANRIKRIIREAKKVGVTISSVAMDMGGPNQAV